MTWFANASNQAAAIAAHAEGVEFVDLDFPSGHLRLHTGSGTINWGGYDWLGVGQLGDIEQVREDAELRPNALRLTLSGVDAALVSAAMTEQYHGRSVSVYLGMINPDTGALIATPETRFRGVMDLLTVKLGRNEGSITVNCESDLARWERPRGLLNTHESQQLLYAGDRFFDMIPVIQSRVINWSKKGRFANGLPEAANSRFFRGMR